MTDQTSQLPVSVKPRSLSVWGRRAAVVSALLLGAVPGVAAAAQAPEAEPAATEGASGGAESPKAPAPEKPKPDADSPATKVRWRPGKGLEVNSEDGRFQLVTRLRGQFLYQAEDSFVSDEDPREFVHGFMLRRARVDFSGHMFGKHNKFNMQLAFSPRDQGFNDLSGDNSPPQTDRDTVPTLSALFDLYMEFDYLRDLTLRVGQYKVPFNRQRVISSGDLMLVDRSSANAEFNLDRDLGLDLRSKDLFGLDLLRYQAGVYIGGGHSYSALAAPGLMTLARVEVLPFGEFDDYSEVDLERSEKPGLSVGLAVAHLENARATRGILGRTPRDSGTTDFNVLTADAMFKWRGFSAQSEFFLRDGSRNPGGALDDEGVPVPTEAARNGYGWFLQAGYLLPSQDLEVSGRYSMVRADEGDTSLSDQSEAGLGVSYYFFEHSFKLQGDYFRLWEDAFDEGDHQFRVQLQTAF